MKILVTSDNHLGFKETDPIRADDSFNTFEEILRKAKREKVQFIIQGGDLFDENRPTRNTYNKTLTLLKEYCLGGEKPSITSNQNLNFLDPDLNISLPILSIHGNHDDPSGFNSVSPLNVLNSSGLIDYFGKVEDVDNIIVEPIVIEGDCKVAIYGIGHIKDRRLLKTFNKGKVHFKQLDKAEKVFNILVLHQNRAPRNEEFISEDLLDPFFDLVIYGHEHESLKLIHKNFDVIQSGSTVRTSLCEGESFDKFAYILDVNEQINISRIKLETVRPLIIETLKVTTDISEELLRDSLLKILERNTSSMLPLLRLKIESTVKLNINKKRIQEILANKVANIDDSVRVIVKAKKEYKSVKTVMKSTEIDDIYRNIIDSYDFKALIQPMVIDSLSEFIKKDMKESFVSLVKRTVNMITSKVNTDDITAESIDDAIKNARFCLLKEQFDTSANKQQNLNAEAGNSNFSYQSKDIDFSMDVNSQMLNEKNNKIDSYLLNSNINKNTGDRKNLADLSSDSIDDLLGFANFE